MYRLTPRQELRKRQILEIVVGDGALLFLLYYFETGIQYWIVLPFIAIQIAKTNAKYTKAIRRLQHQATPTCSRCASSDVSYGGKAVDIAFRQSWINKLTSNALIFLTLLGGWIVVRPVIALVRGTAYAPINVTALATVLFISLGAGVFQYLAKRNFDLSTGNSEDIMWVCESCKQRWIAPKI